MAAPAPVVGKDIESWCTKCKLMLAHTVEAVVGGRVTRVHCNTCGGQHAHRAKPPGSTGTTRPRAKRDTEPKPPNYANLLKGRDPSKAKSYATTQRFAVGDLINHSAFGLGMVTSLRDVNKIEVVFSDGPKVLLHRRG
ncbi:hypothetical protein KF840_03170 [bacterium]|nr:hypothetical protein [bacterium]